VANPGGLSAARCSDIVGVTGLPCWIGLRLIPVWPGVKPFEQSGESLLEPELEAAKSLQ
jgi:hypothetical protein